MFFVEGKMHLTNLVSVETSDKELASHHDEKIQRPN